MDRSPNDYSEILQVGELTTHHRGPPLEYGALPTLIYFSLSGKESLLLDPYCQPVEMWLRHGRRRAISFDLPAHPYQGEHTQAIQAWAQKLCIDHEPLLDIFLEPVIVSLNQLTENGWIDPNQLVVAGLSRGAFMAGHLAARYEKISILLGYAPLTTLRIVKEFEPYLDELIVEQLSLVHLVDKLIKKKTRFYIGNHDTRVGTGEAFHFIHTLSQAAVTSGIRSPQIELIIHPSVGHKGHGTLPKVFKSGIEWLLQRE